MIYKVEKVEIMFENIDEVMIPAAFFEEVTIGHVRNFMLGDTKKKQIQIAELVCLKIIPAANCKW